MTSLQFDARVHERWLAKLFALLPLPAAVLTPSNLSDMAFYERMHMQYFAKLYALRSLPSVLPYLPTSFSPCLPPSPIAELEVPLYNALLVRITICIKISGRVWHYSPTAAAACSIVPHDALVNPADC